MDAVIDAVSADVPKALTALITLGRTLKKRAAEVLAYFDRPGTSNGPTKAINGRPAPSSCAAPPSASATSPTTSPDHYWKQADSDHVYSLVWDEPKSRKCGLWRMARCPLRGRFDKHMGGYEAILSYG